MNRILFSFILTSLAGLATVIGYFVIYLKGSRKKVITFSLAFTSGIMLTISIIDLIPSSFLYLNNYQFFFKILLILFFFIFGLFLSYYIGIKFDSKTSNSLEKIGLISMFAIILHNIPEGIITFMISGQDLNLGIKLALAISMHNIPEGISIAIPIFYATKKKLKTFFYVLISGFSEILGAFLTYFFLSKFINNLIIGLIFSLIAGIMVSISLTKLLPEIFKYKENKYLYLGFLTGSIVMIISHVII